MTRFDTAIATALVATLAVAAGIGVAYFAGHQDGMRSSDIDCAQRVEECSKEVGNLSDVVDSMRKSP